MNLAGIAEVAEAAGVSKQRAHQLAASAGFPQPLDRIAAGPVWRRQDIDAWARKRQENANAANTAKSRRERPSGVDSVAARSTNDDQEANDNA